MYFSHLTTRKQCQTEMLLSWRNFHHCTESFHNDTFCCKWKFRQNGNISFQWMAQWFEIVQWEILPYGKQGLCFILHYKYQGHWWPGNSKSQGIISHTWWRHQMETFSTLIDRSPMNSPHKGQWSGALVFSFIWVNNGESGDSRRHRAHYDVTVMSDVVLPEHSGFSTGQIKSWLSVLCGQ